MNRVLPAPQHQPVTQFRGRSVVVGLSLVLFTCIGRAQDPAPDPSAKASESVSAQEAVAPTTIRDDGVPKQGRTSGAKIIIIETTPEIERSEVIRKVVHALEEDGSVNRVTDGHVGKPVDFIAQLSPKRDTDYKLVLALISELKEAGVERYAFKAASRGDASVDVTAPADVTWRRVQQIEAAIAKHPVFRGRVLVAGSNAPVTPTGVSNLRMPEPERSAPTASGRATPTVPNLRAFRVFKLQSILAADAARIVEQLLINNGTGNDFFAIGVSIDERNNSLIIRGEPDSIAEVEAIVQVLDTESTSSEDNSAADSQTSRFSIGYGDAKASQLREQYSALDQKANQLSIQLHQPLPDPATGLRLSQHLRDTVSEAFEIRQQLQRVELAEFAKRLHGIQQSIEMREKIRQQIIDRRVEELLDPNLKWDQPATASESDSVKVTWPVAPQGPNTASIHAELAGEWELVSIIGMGISSHEQGLRLRIDKGRWTIIRAKTEIPYDLILAPATASIQITSPENDRERSVTYSGIYRLNGGQLQVAWAPSNSPSQIPTFDGSSGSVHTWNRSSGNHKSSKNSRVSSDPASSVRDRAVDQGPVEVSPEHG